MIGNNSRKNGYIFYGNRIYKLILDKHSIWDNLKNWLFTLDVLKYG